MHIEYLNADLPCEHLLLTYLDSCDVFSHWYSNTNVCSFVRSFGCIENVKRCWNLVHSNWKQFWFYHWCKSKMSIQFNRDIFVGFWYCTNFITSKEINGIYVDVIFKLFGNHFIEWLQTVLTSVGIVISVEGFTSFSICFWHTMETQMQDIQSTTRNTSF